MTTCDIWNHFPYHPCISMYGILFTIYLHILPTFTIRPTVAGKHTIPGLYGICIPVGWVEFQQVGRWSLLFSIATVRGFSHLWSGTCATVGQLRSDGVNRKLPGRTGQLLVVKNSAPTREVCRVDVCKLGFSVVFQVGETIEFQPRPINKGDSPLAILRIRTKKSPGVASAY